MFHELHAICMLYTEDMGQFIQIGKRIFSTTQAAASQFANDNIMNRNIVFYQLVSEWMIGCRQMGTGLAVIELERLSDAAGTTANLRMLDETTSIESSFELDSCGADSQARLVDCVGYSISMLAILDVAGFLANGTTPTVVEVDTGASGRGS